PYRDVQPVKPREHEKSGAVRPASQREPELGVGAIVLAELETQEDDAQRNSCEETQVELAAGPLLQSSMRPEQRSGGSEQDHRIDERNAGWAHRLQLTFDTRPRRGPASLEAGP